MQFSMNAASYQKLKNTVYVFLNDRALQPVHYSSVFIVSLQKSLFFGGGGSCKMVRPSFIVVNTTNELISQFNSDLV